MASSSASTSSRNGRAPVRFALGVVLLSAGLLGHLLAAQAIGGSRHAYHDHIFGFFALTAGSAVIIAALGWKFWRGRHDISVLTLGIVQAILGLVIYIERFKVA